ncbi:hypothetical protein Leryth_015144 [Lithospermum erythrorhizon]|nr:hypothetical protein Leryth_015144 [Lithospermum erythrorhizon]
MVLSEQFVDGICSMGSTIQPSITSYCYLVPCHFLKYKQITYKAREIQYLTGLLLKVLPSIKQNTQVLVNVALDHKLNILKFFSR